MYLRENALALLAIANDINLNATAETVLFTCPAGKICIITHIVMCQASAALGTASISFGWNTGSADNVIANGSRTLTGATSYEVIVAASDAVHGVAAGTFKIDVNTAEGGALTADFKVFGFLIEV